jgi:transposase
MRPTPEIRPWLSLRKLRGLVCWAGTKEAYQQRLVIYLMQRHRQKSDWVASMLCVSRATVSRWIAQYNSEGPEKISRYLRDPCGGRRWAYLSEERENDFLEKCARAIRRGERFTTERFHAKLEKLTGRRLSLGYVYRLLHRHRWSMDYSYVDGRHKRDGWQPMEFEYPPTQRNSSP